MLPPSGGRRPGSVASGRSISRWHEVVYSLRLLPNLFRGRRFGSGTALSIYMVVFSPMAWPCYTRRIGGKDMEFSSTYNAQDES